jgi:transcriptional regulator with XRE-family HTH domain
MVYSILDMNIGQLLKQLREEKGLTQIELEKQSGVSQPVISRIEKSNGIPRFDTVCMISDGLGISPKEIWDRIKNDILKIPSSDTGEELTRNKFNEQERHIQRGDG